MHQSIVIKARVDNLEAVESAIFDLTDSLGTFFAQEDVYFKVPHGRLKLRIMHPNRCGQLIFNSCSKMSGQKMTETQVTDVDDVDQIRSTLSAALGELGTIHKKRRVYTTDDVRIYLDEVDQMGTFIDISLTMPSEDPDAVCTRLSDIRRQLLIEDSAIVPVAYLDLLIQKLSFDEDDSDSSSA